MTERGTGQNIALVVTDEGPEPQEAGGKAAVSAKLAAP
jgi:hypothetical protein